MVVIVIEKVIIIIARIAKPVKIINLLKIPSNVQSTHDRYYRI